MIVRIYGDFDDFWWFETVKNKANQTQSKLAPRPALGVEKTSLS